MVLLLLVLTMSLALRRRSIFVLAARACVLRTSTGEIKDRSGSNKIRELSVAPLLAEAIYRVHKAMPFAELLNWKDPVRLFFSWLYLFSMPTSHAYAAVEPLPFQPRRCTGVVCTHSVGHIQLLFSLSPFPPPRTSELPCMRAFGAMARIIYVWCEIIDGHEKRSTRFESTSPLFSPWKSGCVPRFCFPWRQAGEESWSKINQLEGVRYSFERV